MGHHVNLAQSSDSAYHSGTETVLARTLLFFVGLIFTFLMSRSTEFPLKVSPRLRELVAAYDKISKNSVWGGRNHSQLKTYLIKSITALLGGENARGSFGLGAPSTLMNY